MGRRLASAINPNGDNIAYTYNADGLRTSKTVNNEKYIYYWNGDKLTAQTDGVNTWYFRYDGDTPIGFKFNGTEYYYVTNLQGDVIAILDSNGTCVVEYEYDAWGRCSIIKDTNTIAYTNPLLYRGYYYDSDTDLYYLQSRYYDANTGRFINADEPAMMYFGVNNLFGYCDNNPVNLIDTNGMMTYSKTKKYHTIALNEWETNMLLGAIELGSVCASAVVAIIAAVPTIGISFAVAGAIIAVSTLVVGALKYLDYSGGSKGLNFNCSRKWYLPNYIWYNKKEPSGFKSLSQLWDAVKKKLSTILKSVPLSTFKTIAKKKSNAKICRIARVIVDYKSGKHINIGSY